MVVGGGSWGSVFSTLLMARGHDVVLACRDPSQARTIAETGRNPRYLREVDLSGVSATTIDRAPVAEADLVAVAVPSRAFADVPVAILSSSASGRERARIEQYGIGRYITKPPDLDEFLQIGFTLKQLLAERGWPVPTLLPRFISNSSGSTAKVMIIISLKSSR